VDGQDTVFATMRDPARAPQLGELAKRERLPIEIRRLDVDSDESVHRCFVGISEPIDALVNNAGVERHGSIEELPMEAFVATMNTNYFGAVRCIKAILPRMREARKGCIVNISSIAGRVANSSFGPYCASKFALEAISEVLAGEVKPFNIRVAIVEPGIQDTKMPRANVTPAQSACPQALRFARVFPCRARKSRASGDNRRTHPPHHRERHLAIAPSGGSGRRALPQLESSNDGRTMG
jgi:NAD(P)-dependent dehydrogenase (short-subunit alcohol dehydrogenase family)